MKPNRLARWIFRLGVAACVLIVAATVASFWWSFNVKVAGGLVALNYGSVWLFDDSIRGTHVWLGPTNKAFFLWTTKTTLPIVSSQGGFGVTVRTYPTWIFLLATVIPTALAWRKLRRPLPGHCRKCGYDLTGNVTGVCSECGTEIEGDK